MNLESVDQKVLIVDDAREFVTILGDTLKGCCRRSVASNGEKALEMAGSHNPPDLILLDIMMPGMDGYEVLGRLKADPRTREIPVIVVTALGKPGDETKGIELGAMDYITKPIVPVIVRARVKNYLELKRSRDLLAGRSSYGR